jgi:hypothetical protein
VPRTSAAVTPTRSAISAHRLGAQPAVLLLGQVAQRDQGRARLGVEGHELARARSSTSADRWLTGPPRP